MNFDRFNPIGVNAMAYVINGIYSKKDDMTASAESLSIAAVTGLLNGLRLNGIEYGKMINIGKSSMTNLINGMQSKKNNIKAMAKSLSDAAVEGSISGFRSNGIEYGRMIEVGEYAAQGLAQGITNKINEVAEAAIQAAMMAVSMAMQALGESSPSKVFRNIGEYVSIGFALGITDELDTIGDASETAAMKSVNTVSDIVGAITDILGDDDIQPTITPVMDLSNINSGVDYISKAFDDQIQLATYNQAIAANDAFTNARQNSKSDKESNKSDKESVVNNYNFVQNNTSPKALSRIEIYRQTKNQFTRFKEAMG
jgi:hypothetical protein